MKNFSHLWSRIAIIWHHMMNFCSASLIVGAIVGFVQQTMPLTQILVYLLIGGLNLIMSYYKGYLRF